jgi:hypothetical protein
MGIANACDARDAIDANEHLDTAIFETAILDRDCWTRTYRCLATSISAMSRIA